MDCAHEERKRHGTLPMNGEKVYAQNSPLVGGSPWKTMDRKALFSQTATNDDMDQFRFVFKFSRTVQKRLHRTKVRCTRMRTAPQRVTHHIKMGLTKPHSWQSMQLVFASFTSPTNTSISHVRRVCLSRVPPQTCPQNRPRQQGTSNGTICPHARVFACACVRMRV